MAKGTGLLPEGEDDEAVNYFVDVVPRIRELLRREEGDRSDRLIVEFLQHEGVCVTLTDLSDTGLTGRQGRRCLCRAAGGTRS